MPLHNPCRALCAGSLLGMILLSLNGCGPGAGASRPMPPPPEVSVLTVQTEDVPVSVELPGRTSAYLVADVRPQVDGIIRERLFTEGADVAKGAPLYQIDPASYQANEASAEAAVAKAGAALTTARLKAQRYRGLLASKAVSQQDMDEVAALEQQAAAEVAAQEALLQHARIDLGRTRITAPIKGRIGKSSFTAGALVTAGQATALATIQQLDPMYVDITRSSLELLRMREELASGRLQAGKANAANVTLQLENGTTYPHAGRLAFADVTIDPGTASVTLRAVFPNPNGYLLPGMYVRTLLQEGIREKTILIPQQAVIRTPHGGATVMVLDENNTATPRPLVLGEAHGTSWIVESGLQPGDRVVIDGLMKVRPGSVVVPVDRTAAGSNPAAASPTAGKAEDKPADARVPEANSATVKTSAATEKH